MVSIELLAGGVVKYTEDDRIKYFINGAEISYMDNYCMLRSATTSSEFFYFDELDEDSKQGQGTIGDLVEYWDSNGWFLAQSSSSLRSLSYGLTDDGLELKSKPGIQYDDRELKQSQGIEFNGVDQYIDLGNDVGNYSDNFTVCGWINASLSNSFSRILGKRTGTAGYIIYIASNKLSFFSNTTVYSHSETINDDNWQFFVVRFSDGDLDLFQNLSKESFSSVVVNPDTGNATIGRTRDFSNNFLDGSLSDFRVYDSALSDEDITNLYNHESISTKPVNHYKFEEEAGSVALDSGTGQQNGTLVNYISDQRVDLPFNLFPSCANKEGYSEYSYFNEADDHVSIPNIHGNNDVTIEFDTVVFSGDRAVWFDGDGGNFMLASQDGLSSGINSASSGSPSVIIDDVVFSGDRNSLHDLLHDGQVHSVKVENANLSSWSRFEIGRYGAANNYNVNGLIFNLKIDIGSTGTNNYEYLGYGSTPWNDVLGTNHGTISGLDDVSIPTQTANKNLDVFDNAIQFKGQVPYNFKAVNTPYIEGNGVDRAVTIGNTGIDVTSIEVWVKLNSDNQVLFSLQNNALTAVSVVAGALTFGASLSASNIQVDGITSTNSEAGITLNDNSWHKLSFDLVSIAASNLALLTDGTLFGSIGISQFKINATDLIMPLSETNGDAVLDIVSGTWYPVTNPASAMHQVDGAGVLPNWNLIKGYNYYPVWFDDVRFNTGLDLTVNPSWTVYADVIPSVDTGDLCVIGNSGNNGATMRLRMGVQLFDLNFGSFFDGVDAWRSIDVGELSIYTRYRFTITYQSNTIKLWWNGTLIGTKVITNGTAADLYDSILIGRRVGNPEDFKGIIDEVSIWDYVISDSDALGLTNGSVLSENVSGKIGKFTNQNLFKNEVTDTASTGIGTIEAIEIPADLSGQVFGEDALNPTTSGFNGSGAIKPPEVYDLYQKDIDNFLFDATPEAQEIDFDDFNAEGGDVNNEGEITYNINGRNISNIKIRK